MKNNLESRISNITFAFISVVMALSVIFLMNDTDTQSKPNQESVEQIVSEDVNLFKTIQTDTITNDKTFQDFIDDMGFRESSNNYSIVNRFGYKGRYQFGRTALKDLNIHHRKDFISNKTLQDMAFKSLVRINKYRLRKYITKYENKYIHGVYITESGMLAASHLVGSTAVKKFLKHGIVSKDGNGVTVKSYIEKFNGYDIDVEAKRKINLKRYALK